MKYFLFLSILFLIFSRAAFSASPEVNIKLWPAVFSGYYEKPDPAGMETMHIWGDFPCYFAEADINIPILSWLWLNPHVKGGLIGPESMFLGSSNSYLTIGGSIWGFDANLSFRVMDSKPLVLDLYTGFTLTAGRKTFTDFTVLTIVMMAGNFGYYDFTMFGPQVGFKGIWRPLQNEFLITAHFYYSPRYENHTTVAGWGPEPKVEYAEGFRAGGFLLAGYSLGAWTISAGWQFEKIYFSYGALATHDLDITYGGPVLTVMINF